MVIEMSVYTENLVQTIALWCISLLCMLTAKGLFFVLVLLTLFATGCQGTGEFFRGVGDVLSDTGRAMQQSDSQNTQHQQTMNQLRQMEQKASFDRMSRGGLP